VLRLGDAYETRVYEHRPPGPARLPVLQMHGIQSHPGWFVGSASMLADRGHPVFQVTRRGSGDNETDRGHASSAGQLLDDLDAAWALIARRTGAARVHLVGASWGGKLLAAYAARRRDRRHVASLTMVTPGIAPRVDVSGATKLAVALCLLAAPRKRFAIPLNDVELFTDNEAMREYLRGDSLRLHHATARLLMASRQLDRMLAKAPAGSLPMPTTLLLARRDRIIDNEATAAVVRRLAGDDVAVRQFPAAHVLEFEPDPTSFYDALARAVARGEA